MTHFVDIMMDLETLGLGNSPAIAQIALVKFDMKTRQTADQLNLFVDPETCEGLTIDEETIRWWEKQDAFESVILESRRNGVPLKEALEAVSRFVDAQRVKGSQLRIWANGVIADVKWMESAFTVASVPVPWKFWEVSDVRTLCDIGTRLGQKPFRFMIKADPSKAHNALHDCIHQIRYLTLTMAGICSELD